MSQPYYPPPPPPGQYYPPPQHYPPPQQNQYSPVPPTDYGPPVYQQQYQQQFQTSTVAEKWNPRPQFQDLWAAILFLIHFGGFIALSYVGIKDLVNNNTFTPGDGSKNPNLLNLDVKAGMLILLVLATGFVLSLIYMLLMQRFPGALIKGTLYLSIASYFVAAAIYALLRQYVLAVFFVIFGLIYLICAYSWRSRIPFACVMLESVTSVTKKYYGTLIMGFVGLIMQMLYSVWWAVTVVGAYQVFQKASKCTTTKTRNGDEISCENIYIILVMLYLVFSFYWTSQVIKTLVHVTDSGVFAAYYFLEGTPQGTGSTPTLSSLKRACTTSFGSICFGSLIIALLNTVRAILRNAANSGGDGCGAFAAVCIECILGYIEALVQYFNHYAYVQVAIYGKSYCEAGKDTWTMIKDRGVEAIINDNLIGNVLAMGAIFVGALCGLIGFGYVHVVQPAFNADGSYTLVLVLISFLLGLMMMIVVTDVIDSGVATTFVALAEDPEALRRTKPVLYERIRQTWPRVVQGM